MLAANGNPSQSYDRASTAIWELRDSDTGKRLNSSQAGRN